MLLALKVLNLLILFGAIPRTSALVARTLKDLELPQAGSLLPDQHIPRDLPKCPLEMRVGLSLEKNFWLDEGYDLQHLAEGTDGCIYRIGKYSKNDRFNHLTFTEEMWGSGRVLAKIEKRAAIKKEDSNGFEPSNEADMLGRTGKLYHSEVTYIRELDGFHWVIIMVREEGQHLADNDVWKGFFGPQHSIDHLPKPPSKQNPQAYRNYQDKISRCEDFVTGIQKSVYRAVMDLVEKFGVYHNDYHYGNILFSHDLKQVKLVDLGRAVEVNRESKKEMRAIAKEARQMVKRLQIPVKDATTTWPGDPDGPVYLFQGICKSKTRATGLNLRPFQDKHMCNGDKGQCAIMK